MKALQVFLVSVCILLLGLPGVSPGKGPDSNEAPRDKKDPSFLNVQAEGPVDIEADHLSYDKETQVFQAHGNVEVVQGQFTLKADHARLASATEEVVAWGRVVLKEGEDILECERIEVNLKTRVGRIFQGKLFLKDQNFHITSRQADKLGESTYRIRDGTFTTCDASQPPWRFTARELDIDLEGTGTARGPVFYVEDVPIFYFPVITVPIKRERQSGFLLPRVGYSSRHGSEVKTAFYWAIAKNMDATVFLDYLGDRGFKEGAEYQYAFSRETTGKATYYFIHDQEYGNNRDAFFHQHRQKLPSDFYLKADINYVSDRYYPRDFENDLPEETQINARSLNQLRSILFGGKNWDAFSLLASAERYDDLTRDSNATTLQRYPQASFSAYPQPLLKTPLFYDFSLSYTNFWRQEGVRAQRADIFPHLSFPMRLLNVLRVIPDIGFRETAYQVYNDPIDERNGTKTRETFETGVTVATQFFRVYETSKQSKLFHYLDGSRWMHTLEPSIRYSYTPNIYQTDLPTFEGLDRIPYRSTFTYGVTQRLLGKTDQDQVGTGPYEYVRLQIFQDYSLGDPYTVESGGSKKYFSNIQGELWVNLNPYLSFRGKAELSPYRWNFDVLDGLIKVKDVRDDVLQVEYRFTRDKIRQLNIYTKVKTIDPLYLYGSTRYNLLENWVVESNYGAMFQVQCWTLGVLVENIRESPDGTQKKELKVQAFVTLLGLGSLGSRPRIMSL